MKTGKQFRKSKEVNHQSIYPAIILITLILSLIIILIIPGNSSAQDSGGPKTISGQVYKSNGQLVDDKYDGTHVELHIVHGGEEAIYLDYNGIERSWYSITIDIGEWSQGDLYWLIVDGTPWGDINGRTEDKNEPGIDEWRMVGPGSHQLDIKSVAPETVVDKEVVNIEPEIAILCGVIILVFGIYITGPLKKVDVDVMVLSRTLASSANPSKDPRNYVYEFGYGDPGKPVKIGKLSDLDEHLVPNSVVRVRARAVVSHPDGNYSWYKPELLGLETLDKSPLLAPDDIPDLDTLWYASGSVKADKGQTLNSAVRTKYLKLFSGLVLPFIALEFLVGFYSYFYEYPIIPPFFDIALVINLVILCVGILLPLSAGSLSARAKKSVERSKSSKLTIRQWAILPPTSKHATSPGSSRRVDFCGSCHNQVASTSQSCSNCHRSFSSSIEITASEGEKLLARTRGQDQATVPAVQPVPPLAAEPASGTASSASPASSSAAESGTDKSPSPSTPLNNQVPSPPAQPQLPSKT